MQDCGYTLALSLVDDMEKDDGNIKDRKRA
jgi:hypothetical protein